MSIGARCLRERASNFKKTMCPLNASQLRKFDLEQILGFESLLGLDEAGRGALAGPVVAAAVLVSREFLGGRWALAKSGCVNDSKQLTAAEREKMWAEFEELMQADQIHTNYGVASVAEIEALNVFSATKLAMRRALEDIYPPAVLELKEKLGFFATLEDRVTFQPAVSCKILIDGLPLRFFPYPHEGVVKGDAQSLCIAMASIISKVTRDRLMDELDKVHPLYGFSKHKGYGTKNHREAILKYGRCLAHRDSFLKRLFAKPRNLEGQ